MVPLKRSFDSVTAGNEIVGAFERKFDHDVWLYDDTLRDGEQTPGVSFSLKEKIHIAERLLAAGIRHLTLGFPASSHIESTTVRELARVAEGKADGWCLARMRHEDLDAVVSAGVRNVTMFLPGSDVHLTAKLGLTVDGALRLLDDSFAYAAKLNLNVRFALEDASRTPLDRVERFVTAAANCGATMVTLPDTCGVMTPYAAERFFAHIHRIAPRVTLVAHFHNDFGLATANSIAAAFGGANMLQGALGGLGERAGNAALEELAAVMHLKFGIGAELDLGALCSLAADVLRLSGEAPAGNKPLLGSRVFAHESGIHVHGLLRDLASYEPFPPHLIGREHEIRFGKHSGISNIEYLCLSRALNLSPDEQQELLIHVRHRASLLEKVNAETLLQFLRKKRGVLPKQPTSPQANQTGEFSFLLKPSANGIGVFAAHEIEEGVFLRLFGDEETASYKPRRLPETSVPDWFRQYSIARLENSVVCPADFGAMPVGWHLNHSPASNAVCRKKSGLATGYRWFSTRRINAGEEITIDYNALGEPEDERDEFA